MPFLLIFVIFVSGCTIPGVNIEIPGIPDIPGLTGPTVQKEKADVVIIKSLEIIPAEVAPGQSARLTAYVQNVGDKTIKGVNVTLYDYCSGLITLDDLNCPEEATPSDNKESCSNLRLLSLEIGKIDWRLGTSKAKDISLKIVCPKDGMKVSVAYPYNTSGITTISFISQSELERTLERRSYRSEESYISIGKGPIKPYLIVRDEQPIPTYQDAKTVITLKIKDEGSGYLVSDIAKGNVKITLPTGVKLGDECGFKQISGNKYTIKDDMSPIKLIGKESPEMICELNIQDELIDITKETRDARVTITNYIYGFRSSALFTINPKI